MLAIVAICSALNDYGRGIGWLERTGEIPARDRLLSYLEYRSGDFARAIDAARRAIERDPEDLTARFLLTMVFLSDLHRGDRARRPWNPSELLDVARELAERSESEFGAAFLAAAEKALEREAKRLPERSDKMNRNVSRAMTVGWTLVSGVVAGAELFDDFEDGQLLDGDPIVWEAGCPWNQNSWRIQDGDLHLQNATHTNAWLPTVEVFEGDVTLETELRFVGDGGRVRLGLHSFCGPVQAYLAGLNSRGELTFNRWIDNVNDGVLANGSLPRGYDPGAWHRLRFARIGDRLELRVWPTGENPPRVPDLSLEDDLLPRGQVSLGFIKDGVDDWVAFRWVRIFASAPDCNQNGVGDDEDIENGSSRDGDGNGVPDECESELVVFTDTIDFAEVPIGESSERVFEIENRGQAPFRVTSIQVAPGPFELGAAFEPFELAGGDSAVVAIRFRPQSTVEERSSLLVQTDATDNPRAVVALVGTGTGALFIRGDCNRDHAVDISDAVCVLDWLFLGGEAPGCIAAANANGDAGEDISDATYLLNYLFLGGPEPVSPFPSCSSGALPRDAETCQLAPQNCPQ